MKHYYLFISFLGMPFLQAMDRGEMKRRQFTTRQPCSYENVGKSSGESDSDPYYNRLREQIRAVQQDNKRLLKERKPDCSGCLGAFFGLVTGMVVASKLWLNPYEEGYGK